MDATEKAIRQKLKDDFVHYAQKCLKIRTKTGDIGPFELNKAQLHIHQQLENQLGQTGKVRALILKGRQQGCSTYVGARFYHKCTFRFGIQTFILAHEQKATTNLYEMVQRYYEHTPQPVKPSVSKSNAKELIFGRLDSGYKLGTSENKKLGRSNTIQLLHWSEVAYSKNTTHHAKGILQSVADMPGTEIILESTAAGVGNYFHTEWQKAEAGISDYIAIFVPWYWQGEYATPCDSTFHRTTEEEELVHFYGLTDEQLNWRRRKIIALSLNGLDGEKAFRQEYPNNAQEAFVLSGEDNFIDPSFIMRARKATEVEAIGPKIMAVDPARYGDDRTAIVVRQGRKVLYKRSYTKKNTMEVAGLVATLANQIEPDKIIVDVCGLGAGVCDRLAEIFDPDFIVAANGGATPLDQHKYRNKRAEMWATMKQWFIDEPVSIPDEDSLQSDLCNIKYKFDSNSRLLMESKDDMKKRGIRSPDEADALSLTFYYPDTAKILQNQSKKDKIVRKLAQDYKNRVQIMNQGRYK